LASGGEFRKRYEGHWVDTLTDRILAGLNPQTRYLIVKDFRTFRRDPRQWAQILIFAGLALVYFGNSRQLYRSDLGRSFQHGVAFINLTAVCMLLCAYMGRFIYPMLSLEGRKFWILGLMPLSRRRLLFGKFAFAAAGSLAIAVPLVLASDLLLELPVMVVLLHGLTIVCVAAGLSGLAVGIGALLPNFRETDPSKIAVGFGGTMNLLAGLMFLLIEIGLIAGPYHIAAMLEGTESTGRPLGIMELSGMALGAVLATLAMCWPLRAGVRSLEQMEF
jgi:ABC-2 type transport system permease protein